MTELFLDICFRLFWCGLLTGHAWEYRKDGTMKCIICKTKRRIK